MNYNYGQNIYLSKKNKNKIKKRNHCSTTKTYIISEYYLIYKTTYMTLLFLLNFFQLTIIFFITIFNLFILIPLNTNFFRNHRLCKTIYCQLIAKSSISHYIIYFSSHLYVIQSFKIKYYLWTILPA